MKTPLLAFAGFIVSGILTIDPHREIAENPHFPFQTSPSEQWSPETLKSWCSQAGGTWLGQTCEWHNFLEEEQELILNRQCSDRGGIWQTLYEEIIVPNCLQDVCTLEIDESNFEYQETGVGCVWEDDFRG